MDTGSTMGGRPCCLSRRKKISPSFNCWTCRSLQNSLLRLKDVSRSSSSMEPWPTLASTRISWKITCQVRNCTTFNLLLYKSRCRGTLPYSTPCPRTTSTPQMFKGTLLQGTGWNIVSKTISGRLKNYWQQASWAPTWSTSSRLIKMMPPTSVWIFSIPWRLLTRKQFTTGCMKTLRRARILVRRRMRSRAFCKSSRIIYN